MSPRLVGIKTKAGTWRYEKCGCCAGIQWGGEYPRECLRCGGSGMIWRSPKNRLAMYPGGPFLGSDSRMDEEGL